MRLRSSQVACSSPRSRGYCKPNFRNPPRLSFFTPFGQFLSGNGHVQHTVGETPLVSHGNAINSLIWWKSLPRVDIKSDSDAGSHWTSPRFALSPTKTSCRLHRAYFITRSSTTIAPSTPSASGKASRSVGRRRSITSRNRPNPSTLRSRSLPLPATATSIRQRSFTRPFKPLDNTDYSRKKGASEVKALGLHVEKRAEDTWTQKGGSSGDIALLYLSMLRAAGLKAWDMKLVDRERAVFASDYLNFDQLDDDIVILNISDKEILPGSWREDVPIRTAQLASRRRVASGNANGPAPATSPTLPYTANEFQCSGTVYLDEHGGMTGSFRFLMKGQEALHWRQQALRSDLDEVKKQFDRMLKNSVPETVDAQIDQFIGLDDPDLNLVAVINAKGTVGTLTSKRFLLPGYFFEAPGHRPFVNQPNRQSMIDMHFSERVIDQVVYQFPSSFTAEGAPKDASVQFPLQAILDTKVTVAPGQVAITRSLARGFTFLKPEQYQDLRGFYQKVDANDQEQISLLLGAEPKGN